MKSKVVFSTFSAIATLLTMFLLLMALFIADEADETWWAFIILAVAIASTLGVSLWYTPLSIELTDKEIYINRSLSPSKRLPLADIESVVRHNPKNAIRVCASGGFLGYWGWFSESKIGKYFGYFGKTADCFLVTLKSGEKYLLGCQNPDQMVEAIKSKL